MCCVVVALLASYLPVLGAPFIWDDHHLIERTPLVQELHPLYDYFGESFWQSDELGQGRTYYRPLVVLSLALDHHFYGDSPGGFHVTNLIFHVLSTVLLFRLLRARGAGGNAAVLGAALWALHPRLTEAVAWISGRTDVLASFFVLCALLAQARSSLRRRVMCASFLLMGLLCKEVALAGVAAVLVAELAAPGALQARLRRALPTVVALVAYGLLRWHAAGIAQFTAYRDTAPVLPTLAAVGQYFAMLLTPWFPNVQIGRLSEPSVAVAALGCAVLLGLAVWAARRARLLRSPQLGPLALTAVGFGLVLHVVPFSINVVAADRFLYLPLVGLALLLTPVLESFRRAPLVAALASGLALSFAGATFVRANAWSNEVELWADTYHDDPDNRFLACTQLGSLYARAGLFSHAYSLYRGCSVPSASQRVLANNGASVLARTGHYVEAARQIQNLSFATRRPTIFGLNLALFHTYLNDFAAARGELARALQTDPTNAGALTLLEQLPKLEQQRRRVDTLPEGAPPIDRARLYGQLGLAVESLRAWRAACASGSLSRSEFEEGLSFALAQGDAQTIEELWQMYAARVAGQPLPKLEIAYQAHRELVERLLGWWPAANLKLLALPS
jgi:tetratricopeptide (TPR) repeat protein